MMQTMIDKARVEYSLARTINMGNYESTKIHVGLSLECESTKEEVGRAFEKAKRFVEVKMAQQEHEWKVGGGE